MSILYKYNIYNNNYYFKELYLYWEIFQFCNGFISDNDQHPPNIYSKLVPFDIFQFCNGFISDNDEHL